MYYYFIDSVSCSKITPKDDKRNDDEKELDLLV